jgi:hypothetical protein
MYLSGRVCAYLVCTDPGFDLQHQKITVTMVFVGLYMYIHMYAYIYTHIYNMQEYCVRPKIRLLL